MAEVLFRQARAIDEKNYGHDHVVVARDVRELAFLLHKTGRYIEAETLHRQALKIDEASYGPESADVACDYNNLAALLKDMGRLGEAKSLFDQAELATAPPATARVTQTYGLFRTISSLSKTRPGRTLEQAKTLRPATHDRRPRTAMEEAETLRPEAYVTEPIPSRERREIVARIEFQDHPDYDELQLDYSKHHYNPQVDGKDRTFDAMRHWQPQKNSSQSVGSRLRSLLDDNPTSG